MAFQDDHAPSISAKVLISAGILVSILLSAALMSGYADGLNNLLKYGKAQGKSWQQIIGLGQG